MVSADRSRNTSKALRPNCIYQHSRCSTELTPELRNGMHDVTPDKTSFAMKVFFLAQVRAIVSSDGAIFFRKG